MIHYIKNNRDWNNALNAIEMKVPGFPVEFTIKQPKCFPCIAFSSLINQGSKFRVVFEILYKNESLSFFKGWNNKKISIPKGQN